MKGMVPICEKRYELVLGGGMVMKVEIANDNSMFSPQLNMIPGFAEGHLTEGLPTRNGYL